MKKFLAKVELPVNILSVRLAVLFVRDVLKTLLTDEDVIISLEVALEEAVANVVKHSGLGENDTFSVTVWERPAGIEVEVFEKGVPVMLDKALKEASSEKAEDFVNNPSKKGLGFYIMTRVVDEVSFSYQARFGKKIRLFKRMKFDSILQEERKGYTGEVDFDRLKCGLLSSSDAMEIARCIWYVYGYSYLWDVVYYPEKLKRFIDTGKIIPFGYWIEEDAQKKLIAHCALENPGEEFSDIEIGMAVVVPQARKRGLLKEMTEKLLEYAAQTLRKKAAFVQAVANHEISQKVAFKNGFRPTAVPLSFLPTGMSFDGSKLSKRGSVVVFYRLFEKVPKIIFIPFKYVEITERVYDLLGVGVDIAYPEKTWDSSPHSSEGFTLWKEDQKAGYLFFKKAGYDASRIMEERFYSFKEKGAEVCYVDVNIEDEETASFIEWLNLNGFSFAGIMPSHIEGEDYMRLQWVDRNKADFDNMKVIPEVEFLKEYIISELQ